MPLFFIMDPLSNFVAMTPKVSIDILYIIWINKIEFWIYYYINNY